MDEFREIQAGLCDDTDEDRRSGGSCCGCDDDNNAYLSPLHSTVLQQGVDGCQPLPLPLDGDLPHFVLNIGHSTSAPNPSLTHYVDTDAGANVGSLGTLMAFSSNIPNVLSGSSV